MEGGCVLAGEGTWVNRQMRTLKAETGQAQPPPPPSSSSPGTLVGPTAEVFKVRMWGECGDRDSLLRGTAIYMQTPEGALGEAGPRPALALPLTLGKSHPSAPLFLPLFKEQVCADGLLFPNSELLYVTVIQSGHGPQAHEMDMRGSELVVCAGSVSHSIRPPHTRSPW